MREKFAKSFFVALDILFNLFILAILDYLQFLLNFFTHFSIVDDRLYYINIPF